MKKLFKILISIPCALIALFLLAWAVLAIARVACYPDYVANKDVVCKIPSIHDGFVPQGVAHVKDNTYIFTGYNEDEMEIHLSKGGEHVRLIPVDADGQVLDLHGGGVTVVKSIVYITGDNSLLAYDLSTILSAKDGDRISYLFEKELNVKSSYCFSTEEYLYVGEFYDGNKYKTDESHHLTTPAGDAHYALTAVYTLDANGLFLYEDPTFYLSTRNKVQGFAVSGDTYVLSSSYGLTSSELDFYNGATDNGATITLDGKEYPLLYLDSATHRETVSMPAFSEGLDVVDDRVIISFESACNKYVVGKLFFADKLISYPIN